MKIDPKNLTDIIFEETIKVLAEKRGFLRHAYKKFMQDYEKAKTGGETQPSPQEQPTKKSADSAWGTQGYQDVEWSPSEPQALAPTPDKPSLGPSVEKTAIGVGITDEELLQKLVAKLKGIEVVSDDRPTLTGQQVKDILMNLGAEDATDPETSGISDEFVEKVIDQGRLYERVMRVLTEQKTRKALIIGDSQGNRGATGGHLASILSSAGYKVVNNSVYGTNTSQAAKQVPSTDFDLVVLFTGGHRHSKPADALKIAKAFPPETRFIISGPPPVQRIKDIHGSVKKFPYLANVPKEELETYFVEPKTRRAKDMFKGRERRNSAFAKAAQGAGIPYVDPRVVFGVTRPADFPIASNADGIHMYGEVAAKMAQALAKVIDKSLKAKAAAAPAVESKLAQRAMARSGRCNKAGYIGFGSEKMGDKHQEIIAKLQRVLRSNKLMSIEDIKSERSSAAVGIFGPKTLDALIKVQQFFKLKPDGCLGPQTAGKFGANQFFDPKNEISFVATWDELKQLAAGEAATPEEEPAVPEGGEGKKVKAPKIREVEGRSSEHGRIPKGKLPEIVKTIKDAAAKHGVDEDIIMGVVQMESGFNPYAKSPTGARGLFQFVGSTGRTYGLETDEDFYDAEKGADAGARFMKTNIKKAEKANKGPLDEDTEFMSYVIHNMGHKGMREIFKSANSGGKIKLYRWRVKKMNQQGKNVRKAMADNPDNPAQGFIDYFRKKWKRVKPKGVAIAASVGPPKAAV